MNSQVHNQIVNFIWGIADDCLRDVYVRGKYRDVILPMTVIRRLDAVLEDTKSDVLKMKDTLDKAGISNQADPLCKEAKQSFCNWSPFKLKDLTSRVKPQQLKVDFEEYLDGFSPNVQEILAKFKFREQINTMVEANILSAVIGKFVNSSINLSPYPVLEDNGEVKLPALDNHTMGTVFEELIRRFNEENNEEAGEHFTPRDVVELMADLIFVPIEDKIKDSTYSVYDGASGTGGMLTVSEQRLLDLAKKAGKTVSIHLFGQEINPETYAIAKADMLIKGDGSEAENIAFNSTLSNDAFPSRQFDFMLSNPPYGKSWKVDLERMGGKKDIADTRFVTQFDNNPTYSMIPRTSDGQMLFLLNNVSKMKDETELGSRIAEVHNGSSLFTGDAGQGESNARRYLLENDLVEAIIALPNNMFYNTGIGTFIWVLSNRKEEKRKGKVQLIDATNLKSPLRKNLGQKNCELTPEIRKQIMDIYLDFTENEYSKIFNNSAFGYWKITVMYPKYHGMLITDDTLQETKKILEGYGVYDKDEGVPESEIFSAFQKNPKMRTLKLAKTMGEKEAEDTMRIAFSVLEKMKRDEPYLDMEEFKGIFFGHLAPHYYYENNGVQKIEVNSEGAWKILPFISAYIHIEHPKGSLKDFEGKIDYDTTLTDTENIPLDYPGGIDAFMKAEVLPYAPDAWVVESKTQIGYEISFTKYFYKPVQLRELSDIVADIRKLEAETDGLLNEVLS